MTGRPGSAPQFHGPGRRRERDTNNGSFTDHKESFVNDRGRSDRDVLAKRVAAPKPNTKVPKLDIRNPPTRVAHSTPVGGGDSEVKIAKGSKWRYLKGTREAASGWRSAGFDDSKWPSGPAPFGYGDGPFGTTLDDTKKAGYTTLFIRQKFQVPDPAAVSSLEFNVDFDDGFVIWINGKEAASVNKPTGRITHKSLPPARRPNMNPVRSKHSRSRTQAATSPPDQTLSPYKHSTLA